MAKAKLIKKTKKFISHLLDKKVTSLAYSAGELGYFYCETHKRYPDGTMRYEYIACYNNNSQCYILIYDAYDKMMKEFIDTVYGGKDNGDLRRTSETQ